MRWTPRRGEGGGGPAAAGVEPTPRRHGAHAGGAGEVKAPDSSRALRDGPLSSSAAAAQASSHGPVHLTEEDEAALQEALDRSSRHLNGLPCFLLQAYRCYRSRLDSPEVMWAGVLAALDAAATSGTGDAPRDVFDGLLVLAMHTVQVQLYPAFLHSACFRLYANMLHFAFNRPAFSRDSFIWLKVRSAVRATRGKRAEALFAPLRLHALTSPPSRSLPSPLPIPFGFVPR